MSGFGQRSNYKKVWDLQAQDVETAKLAVAGLTDEATLDATADVTIATLENTVGIHPGDIFLEIGCGVGRVGKRLAQRCFHWIGTDISGEMIRHASDRLSSLPNVSFVELHTVGLGEFCSDSLDVVYCTVVFMHLLEWDRFRYVEEAFRVLRPGGRCYFDNFALHSEFGWNFFRQTGKHSLETRPAHISMSSTRDELGIYLHRAGFVNISLIDLPNGHIAAVGQKPRLYSPPAMPEPIVGSYRETYDAHLARVKNIEAASDKALQFAIGGEFEAVGKLERELLISLGLQPTSNVVDVGCGSGRLALPLSHYLTTGLYFGFDIVSDFVEHARQLTQRPNWIFKAIDRVEIPLPDKVANYVCFFSVFTHLLHDDCYRYLAEAKRVLVPGGTIVFSFLEFAIPCHWDVFESDLRNPGKDRVHNQFISRDAIQAWATHLNLQVIGIFDGDKPHFPLSEPVLWTDGKHMETHGNLGQSVAVLQTDRA